MDIKDNWGGARPGAGRKKTTKKTTKKVTFQINLDLVNRIANIKNKSRFFNEAIREKLDRLESTIKDVEELDIEAN